jgi:hypothetical protein
MERTNAEILEELKETLKRKSYFIAGMKLGAKYAGSKIPGVEEALDFDDFDKQYKEDNV